MLRPLIFLLFVWIGWRRLRVSPDALRRRRNNKTEGPRSAKPVNLTRVRIGGAIWLAIGVAGFALLPLQIDYRPVEIRRVSGSEELANQILPTVADYADRYALATLAVSVVADARETTLAFGRERVLSAREVDHRTIFEIGSITKTFTGVLLAKMIEEGKVKLDQPVVSLLPKREWGNPQQQITLRQLATHTSGLPRLPPDFFTPVRAARAAFSLDPYAGYSEEELLAAFENLTPDELKPGSKAAYSNFGVGLLGLALARNEGGSYEDVIRREICKPLGMDSAMIHLTPDLRSRLAKGYTHSWHKGAFWLLRPGGNWLLPNAFAGAGALRSNIKDMTKYLKAAMGSSSNSLTRAFQSSIEDLAAFEGSHRVGMNWIRKPGQDGAPDVVWHNGGTGGYHSFLGFTRDGRYGVTILSGSTSDAADHLGMEILRILRTREEEGSAKPPR